MKTSVAFVALSAVRGADDKTLCHKTKVQEESYDFLEFNLSRCVGDQKSIAITLTLKNQV